MSKSLREMASPLWLGLARKAAEAYVVGPELQDAMNVASAMAREDTASTICFWDGQEDAPDQVAGQYVNALRKIARSGLDSYLSVKAPSLGFDAGLIALILDQARSDGLAVHFDSLGPETADRTFRLIEDLRSQHTRLGCTLPGRWRRSLQDAEWAASLGLRVRVVKGQWPDTGAGGPDLRRGFLDVVEALAGRAKEVAVATHDPLVAESAVRKLRAAGTHCELELLFGLPSRAVLEVSRELAVPVRMYLPYGHAWLPYALRQAKRNPRILWWVLRDSFAGRGVGIPKRAQSVTRSL
jgi:proline dehydrogenase